MSNETLTEDGWTREFWFQGDEKAADAEASAYVEGIADAEPTRFEVERQWYDNRIEVIVRDRQHWLRQCRSADCEVEHRAAFRTLYREMQRRTPAQLGLLLRDLSDVADEISSPMLLIAALRLTALHQDQISEWNSALAKISGSLQRRGLDPQVLLVGFTRRRR